jgi:Phosphotransferase enzyme family
MLRSDGLTKALARLSLKSLERKHVMAEQRFDDYYVIIPHPTTGCILFLRSTTGWALPKATVPLSPDDGRWRDTFRVNAAFHQLLGITVTVLECLFVSPFPKVGQHGSSVFAMSNHDEQWNVPSEGVWISYDMLETLSLANPEHRILLEHWLTKSPPDDQFPWTRDGWFEEASDWIHTKLREHGLVALGPIEQTRSWFISSLLRLPTTDGEVYFKAVPPTDVHEPLLTQMLSIHFATLVPRVLAVHKERRWLLMKAVPGQKMPSHTEPLAYLPRWAALLQTYARMQRDYTRYTEELLALGCHDWRLDQLAERIEPFFAELPSLLRNAQHPLSKAEQALLHGCAPRLKTFCAELAQLGIPASLHHGDFHRGNILVNEKTCTLIDWSGFVGVTHPFLSLWLPLSDWDQQRGQYLREQYLAVWSDVAPLEHLRSAVTWASPLAALCGALGHREQLYHAHSALPWDFLGEQDNLLDCLRSMLALMKQI